MPTQADAVAQFGTTELSDALDRLGIAGQCAGIMPLSRDFRLCGRAYTVRYASVGLSGKNVGDFIDDVPAGAVVVIDNGGRLDATVWGDIMTLLASRNGVAGTVIDGVCRDTDRSIELSYPIFSRGNWMRTGKDRVCVEAVETPVTIGGIRIEPGDFVRGDGDGIVALPHARLNDVTDAATRIRDAEDRIREAVAAGSTLREARLALGYHALQTRVTA